MFDYKLKRIMYWLHSILGAVFLWWFLFGPSHLKNVTEHLFYSLLLFLLHFLFNFHTLVLNTSQTFVSFKYISNNFSCQLIFQVIFSVLPFSYIFTCIILFSLLLLIAFLCFPWPSPSSPIFRGVFDLLFFFFCSH